MVTETFVETPLIPLSAQQGYIEQALRQLKLRGSSYERYNAYYEGSQPLTFTSEKYDEAFAKMVAKYTENMCPAVVDSVADRLRVTGFAVEGTTGEEFAQAAQDLWDANRMDEHAGQVHVEALKEGDSYVIVWPDVEQTNLVRIWPQDANGITVYYSEDVPNKIEWAAKWWLTDQRMGRLTMYFADRIERYITNNKLQNGQGIVTKYTALKEFEPPQRNPYGQVPVFHFSNNASIGSWGKSELHNVLPVQDALNKAVCDMLVAMEFSAFPQRWATGIQVKLDEYGKPIAPWKPGVDRIWSSGNEAASFGQFQTADLTQMLAVQNRFKQAIADITGTPSHYMQMATISYPSGESLKTAEARFVSKIEDRQISLGNTWEDVMKFALMIEGTDLGETQLSTTWRDASPRSDQDIAAVSVLKKQVGVSNTQLQREMGYSEDQITKMAAENQQAQADALDHQVKLFNAGGSTPFGGA